MLVARGTALPMDQAVHLLLALTTLSCWSQAHVHAVSPILPLHCSLHPDVLRTAVGTSLTFSCPSGASSSQQLDSAPPHTRQCFDTVALGSCCSSRRGSLAVACEKCCPSH